MICFIEEGFVFLIFFIFVVEVFEKLFYVMVYYLIYFLELLELEMCFGFCVFLYISNNRIFNDINFWIENFIDVWFNKSIRDCLLEGGNWIFFFLVEDYKRELEVFFMFVILFCGIFFIVMVLKGMKIILFFFS